MLQWLSEHHDALNLLVNLGILLVWVVYLQVFLGNYRRQQRPKILVNRGGGPGIQARCLVSNMSAEAIYVQSIIATLENGEQQLSAAVTDLEDLEAEEEVRADPKQSTRQGPLASGGYMDIGSFAGLIERVLRSNGAANGRVAQGNVLDQLAEECAFEIQVIANYGSENLLVGGKRRFDLLKRAAGLSLHPHSLDSEQITSRWERRRIETMLRDYL